MRLPTDRQIRALHEKYAPTPQALEVVHSHCTIVADLAEQFVSRSRRPVDAALVRAGALLHDIGVYRLFDGDGRLDHASYIRHGILGHELLRAEGLPEALCRFCSCHTGVGVTRADIRRQNLDLPEADYVATTPEEELVMYADKFHTKTTPAAFVTADAYAAHVARFGEEKVTAFQALRARYGEPDLAALQGAGAPSAAPAAPRA
ncbi:MULTISPECIES: HD domain-containing protein [Streptomyces]|uniref:HD domain-containing protein n=1 Tax=Streptomyces luteosporeus TaxID=173856 RepID=A0ABP6G521_9ACTN